MQTRRIIAEIMDDPGLDAAEHYRALRGLSRINAVSNAAAPIALEIGRRRWHDETIHILDIAVGSGDVSLRLAKSLNRSGLNVRLVGLDISERAVNACRERFQNVDCNAEFHVANALLKELPEADVVMCSLFLHHLQGSDIVRLLTSMRRAAKHLIVVTDLVRSRSGLAASFIVPRVLTQSRVVHVDAVRSYRAALSRNELSRHADDAGLTGARIRSVFPFRMLLSWEAQNPQC